MYSERKQGSGNLGMREWKGKVGEIDSEGAWGNFGG